MGILTFGIAKRGRAKESSMETVSFFPHFYSEIPYLVCNLLNIFISPTRKLEVKNGQIVGSKQAAKKYSGGSLFIEVPSYFPR